MGDEGGAGGSHTPQQQLQALHQHWQQQQVRQSPNGPSVGPDHGGTIMAVRAPDPRVSNRTARRSSEGTPLVPQQHQQPLAHQPRSRLAAGGVGLGIDTAVGGNAEGLGDVLRLDSGDTRGAGGAGGDPETIGGGQGQQQQQGGAGSGGQGAGGATSPTAVAWAAAVSLGSRLLSLGGGSRREERSAGQ